MTIAQQRHFTEIKTLLFDFIEGRRKTVNGQQVLKCCNRASFVDLASKAAVRNGFAGQGKIFPRPFSDLSGECRLIVVFDQFIFSSSNCHNWIHGNHVAILDAFPAAEITREVFDQDPHASLIPFIGKVALKTDLNFWLHLTRPEIGGAGVPWGPFGPLLQTCPLGVRDLDHDQAVRLGLIRDRDRIAPVDLNFHPRFAPGGGGVDAYLDDILHRLLFDPVSPSELSGNAVGN